MKNIKKFAFLTLLMIVTVLVITPSVFTQQPTTPQVTGKTGQTIVSAGAPVQIQDAPVQVQGISLDQMADNAQNALSKQTLSPQDQKTVTEFLETISLFASGNPENNKSTQIQQEADTFKKTSLATITSADKEKLKQFVQKAKAYAKEVVSTPLRRGPITPEQIKAGLQKKYANFFPAQGKVLNQQIAKLQKIAQDAALLLEKSTLNATKDAALIQQLTTLQQQANEIANWAKSRSDLIEQLTQQFATAVAQEKK